MTFIIDGKAVAAELRAEIARTVQTLKRKYGLVPGLALVSVGDNQAGDAYVKSKANQALAMGMHPFIHRLPAETSQSELLSLVSKLNIDPSVHGILVQLPLPSHIAQDAIISAILPDKDVDGLHPANAGSLAKRRRTLIPCTPLGCVILAKKVHTSLEGLEAVVIGRSELVGNPLAQLLLAENATVTVAHSKTRGLPEVCRRADLLVAAVGRPRLVGKDWVKPGATVIDVGINRFVSSDGQIGLVGDVDFDQARDVAGAITPVPGGVGPMTIACLLLNTVRAACGIAGINAPNMGH